jgi:hypothetical protein
MQTSIACHYPPDSFQGDSNNARVGGEEISGDFVDETKFGRGVSLTAVFVLAIASNSDQPGGQGTVSRVFTRFFQRIKDI